jgi:hypothetical protein
MRLAVAAPGAYDTTVMVRFKRFCRVIAAIIVTLFMRTRYYDLMAY